MKNMKRNVLSICFGVLLIVSQRAFALSSSWDKMNDLYRNCTSYSMNVGVGIYGNNNQSIAAYNGNVKRSGDLMIYSMMGMITLMNDHYWVNVDEARKTIVYAKRDKSKHRTNEYDVAQTIDSLTAKSPKPTFKGKSGVDDLYELQGDKSFYDRIDFCISTEGYIKKIIYYYVSSEDAPYNRTEITYSSIELNQTISVQTFSEAQFIVFKSGKVYPASTYTGYKVIDENILIPSSYEK